MNKLALPFRRNHNTSKMTETMKKKLEELVGRTRITTVKFTGFGNTRSVTQRNARSQSNHLPQQIFTAFELEHVRIRIHTEYMTAACGANHS
jgi:hypothetical protein